MTNFADSEIERRSSRGKRLAERLKNDLPKGMSYEEFILRPEIGDLELDFITSSEMYKAYSGEKE